MARFTWCWRRERYADSGVEYGIGIGCRWSGHGKLVFHLCNASEFMIPFTLTIRDAGGATFKANHLWMLGNGIAKDTDRPTFARTRGAARLSRVRSMQFEIHSAEKFESTFGL